MSEIILLLIVLPIAALANGLLCMVIVYIAMGRRFKEVDRVQAAHEKRRAEIWKRIHGCESRGE
jgi:adenosyl cobinamide kinase/adenosyl cobinamide phosphate guanylyltransferase